MGEGAFATQLQPAVFRKKHRKLVYVADLGISRCIVYIAYAWLHSKHVIVIVHVVSGATSGKPYSGLFLLPLRRA